MRQWLHALGETPRMAPIHLAVPPPNPGQRALPPRLGAEVVPLVSMVANRSA